MSNRSLNLIYSSKTSKPSDFFYQIKQINNIVLKFKKDEISNDFSPDDEKELGRGTTYAVFPELTKQTKQNRSITIDDFRNSLGLRGVSDPALQNKILSLILQSKLGIQFGLGGVLNSLFVDNEEQKFLASNYALSFEVRNNQRVKLIYSTVIRDITKKNLDTDFTAKIEIDITPNRVAIDKFIITQLSETPNSNSAFKNLEANQVNILMKIILFLMNYFKMNSDIEIENVYYDKTPWDSNTRKYGTVQQDNELDEWDQSEINDPSVDGLNPSFISLNCYNQN